ncbi:MAG: hypothetical protein AB7J35_21620 [Dehalococcoidia bacterium]
MDIERARFLVSQKGREALADLPADLPVSNPTLLATTLRRSFPPEEASALAEQLTLRARAFRNHGIERDFLFTADGLEMMTHPVVAQRRAQRLAALGAPCVDATTGIGGDLFALAQTSLPAIGLERDPVHAILAAANTNVPVIRANALYPPVQLARRSLLIDPSRRSRGNRRFDPSAFSPPWDQSLALATTARIAVIKAQPGIDDSHIPPDAEIEAIQVGRSMRELTIWLGAGAAPGLRRAVLLPEGAELDSSEPQAGSQPGPVSHFLFDPESCVTLATLVLHLAHRLDGWLLDPHIAYLSAASPAFSPLAATFEILDSLPFSVSRLKDRLRAGGWRPEDIRRRAFPVEPDELRKLLGRLEGDPVTLVLTTLNGQRTVFICRRLFAPA